MDQVSVSKGSDFFFKDMRLISISFIFGNLMHWILGFKRFAMAF